VDFEEVTPISVLAANDAGAPTDGKAGMGPPPSRRRRRRPRRWRRWVGVFILVVVAGGAGYAYWKTRREEPVRYVTAPVARGTVAVALTATGTVNPATVVQVGTYVSGPIERWYCDYNTSVTVGQICAQIDPRPFQMVADQARANLAVARAQLAKDQATLALAKTTYERDRGLLQRGIVSQATVDSDKSTYEQAQAQITYDESAIAEKQAEFNAAQVNLGYTKIISPVNGTVVSRNIEVGQTVAASFQTPILFLIATDLTKMQVDTSVSESDIGGAKVGDRATFTVQAFPNRQFQGRVRQVRQAPVTVQNVVTYDVVVSVDNRDGLLKPGMTATTRIIKAERDDVLTVPAQAVRFRPERLTAGKSASAGASRPARPAVSAGDAAPRGRVWLLRDGKPTAVPITVGLDDGNSVEVVHGEVQVGDRVIVAEATSEASGGPQRQAPPRFFRSGGR
jgi:HlyD family secretion protein